MKRRIATKILRLFESGARIHRASTLVRAERRLKERGTLAVHEEWVRRCAASLTTAETPAAGPDR